LEEEFAEVGGGEVDTKLGCEGRGQYSLFEEMLYWGKAGGTHMPRNDHYGLAYW